MGSEEGRVEGDGPLEIVNEKHGGGSAEVIGRSVVGGYSERRSKPCATLGVLDGTGDS